MKKQNTYFIFNNIKYIYILHFLGIEIVIQLYNVQCRKNENEAYIQWTKPLINTLYISFYIILSYSRLQDIHSYCNHRHHLKHSTAARIFCEIPGILEFVAIVPNRNRDLASMSIAKNIMRFFFFWVNKPFDKYFT